MRIPKVVALVATDAPKRIKPFNYPPPFASQMEGREKRPLGDLFDQDRGWGFGDIEPTFGCHHSILGVES
jgi:hypothetical protein